MNKWTTADSSEANGGFYHGKDHAYYGSHSCPTCGYLRTELVPIPRCESDDVHKFEQVIQIVICQCGELYKAIYNWADGEVLVFTPTEEQEQERQRRFLDDQKN